MVTVKDIQKSQIYPEAAKDKKGSLVVAAAIGTGPESFQRAEQLSEAGADVIILDTAHGHSASVLKTLEKIKPSPLAQRYLHNFPAAVYLAHRLQLQVSFSFCLR